MITFQLRPHNFYKLTETEREGIIKMTSEVDSTQTPPYPIGPASTHPPIGFESVSPTVHSPSPPMVPPMNSMPQPLSPPVHSPSPPMVPPMNSMPQPAEIPPLIHPHGPPPAYSESPPRPMGWESTSTTTVQSRVITQQPQHHSTTMYYSRNPQTVIINQTGLMSNVGMRCPACRTLVGTKVTFKPGCKTHTWACVLCLLGCWFCAPLPYCSPNCMNQHHHCANCGTPIAIVT